MRRVGAVLAALLGMACAARALDCPQMPQQAQRDWDLTIAIAVGRLGQASGTELQSGTRSTTTDLLRRLPNADRVYIEQMMYATYCSTLRDNPALSEAERNARVQAYNRELRATMRAAPKPAVDPREAARAELARLPVEYTARSFVQAAENGKAAVVNLFLQAGFDPNAIDGGATALMQAAHRGDLAMVEALLKARADVNLRAPRGVALGWAAGNGQLAVVQRLLKAGAARDGLNQVLWFAFRDGHFETARWLIAQGANLRVDDGRLATALGQSKALGPERVATMFAMLREAGWPVNAEFDGGQTALMLAAYNGDAELVSMLLRAGAAPDRRCECRGIFGGGHSALTLAARGDKRETVQGLLDGGGQVDAPGPSGTALYWAADGGRAEMVELLLARGADPKKASSRQGVPVLFSAVHAFDNVRMLKALLAAGAEVDAAAPDGYTALLDAAESDFTPAVRVLLDARADPERRDRRGRTALLLAVIGGGVDTTRLLLERGARVDVVDEDQRSPIDHAQSRLKGEDRDRILSLLRRGSPSS